MNRFRREAATEFSPGRQPWEHGELIESPGRGGRICRPSRLSTADQFWPRAYALG